MRGEARLSLGSHLWGGPELLQKSMWEGEGGKGDVNVGGAETRPCAGRAVSKGPGPRDQLEREAGPNRWPLVAHARTFWALLNAGVGYGRI